MPYFTSMRLVFEALPGICEAHDWLISDLDCSWISRMTNESAKVDERFLTRALLLDGKELTSGGALPCRSSMAPTSKLSVGTVPASS
jgi:hypothetical protein